jgi:hypothetical protein
MSSQMAHAAQATEIIARSIHWNMDACNSPDDAKAAAAALLRDLSAEGLVIVPEWVVA